MNKLRYRFDSSRGSSPRAGWSLLELLVVIGILALLIAILIPSLSQAREQARRAICKHNLRQWGHALQFYRDEHNDYLPTEGTTGLGAHRKPNTWYNTLPLYLDLPAYMDVEGVNDAIKEYPGMHVWICPSKNLTMAYKSESGKNQFHYGMNQVLDGMGTGNGSAHTPGFPDQGEKPLRARLFAKKPHTVFMFDIYPNSPRGFPREVATEYQRHFLTGGRVGKFHGDYANVLYLNGGVENFTTDDFVKNHNFKYGAIRWKHPRLYWGWLPPVP